jgi:tagatose-1,6-bisphosphate aldolase non-catalytic subunit AgaZ/GatZ
MWTWATVGFHKRDIDHGIAALIDCRPPMGSVLASRAASLFGLPVDLEARQIKAKPLLGLPPMVPRGWSEQVNAIRLTTLDEPSGFD